jgi:hypothetical protein
MSHRPTSEKKLRRFRKQLRKNASNVPALIDLVDYLRTRGHASTTGEARKIILAGRVRADSHTLGVRRVPTMDGDKVAMVDIVDPLIPADLRGAIQVLPE